MYSMLMRTLALVAALTAMLGACNTGTTTLEDMQRNQRMATMRAA